jgi:hypothetical protein
MRRQLTVPRNAPPAPTSFRTSERPEGPLEASRARPVYYMSPSDPDPKSGKFITHRSLLIIGQSPLSRPPGHSVGHSGSSRVSNSGDCPAGHPERNLESCMDCYPISYGTSSPARNSANYSMGCGDRCSPGGSADCPENCGEGNPESRLPSNGANGLLSYSEGNPAGPLAGSLAGSTLRLVRENNLANRGSSLLAAHSSLTYEVHPRCQRPHIIRAGMEVHHLPSNRI